jgi:hypothetical protein
LPVIIVMRIGAVTSVWMIVIRAPAPVIRGVVRISRVSIGCAPPSWSRDATCGI